MKLNNVISKILIESKKPPMKIYLVGGAVRDRLMGKKPKDLDYVVVGSTPEEMISKGFSQVGADFPVFLDKNGDEYALARTERKTGSGHKGFDTSFDPSTTLKDDLSRRDLTINAMAQDLKTGEIIDPFGGQKDLKDRVLRHVSDAFAEDPLRVLRVARFASRFDFTIAPETKKLMKGLSDSGELDTLSSERVWKEASRAMMETHPQNFAKVINEVGALKIIFGELGVTINNASRVLKTLANRNANERQRWMGVVLAGDNDHLNSFIKKNKVPNDVADAMRFTKIIESTNFSNIDSVMSLLNNTRAWTNHSLLDEYAQMINWINPSNKLYLDKLSNAIDTASKVGFENLSREEQQNLKGPEIGKAIESKRKDIIQRLYI